MTRWTRATLGGLVGVFFGCNAATDAAPMDENPTEQPELAVATYELRIHIPQCLWISSGQVYYVSSEEQFYYCDGWYLRPIELSGDPTGTSWLTGMGAASEDDCPAGGIIVSVGPDEDNDAELGDDEIASSAALCNGQDGADGQDGSSCTVADNGDGTKTLSCEDGTSVTLSDGQDGQDGSSCTVTDNGDGTKTLSCEDGTSITISDAPDGGAPTPSCQSGLVDCAGVCRDLSTDYWNCGACGTPCAAGEMCIAGVCQVSCGGGLTNCAGVCRDLETDRANCGRCGDSCAAGEICDGWVCQVSCGGGLTNCAGVCRDLGTDRANCGSCGNACAAGDVCSFGACL